MESIFNKYLNTIYKTDTIHYTGSVTSVKGLVVESKGPYARVGELCYIRNPIDKTQVAAEVMGFDNTTVKLMAFGDTKGIVVGAEVSATGNVLQVPVGNKLLGRVIDATGVPMDGLGPINPTGYYPVVASAPNPMTRPVIKKRIVTGVRVIDSLLTCGQGQRLGIFAGSGVGKSTLLSTIARNTNADINVIGLIGERGREVREFIENDLGEEGLKRSVVVVSTGDTSSIQRLRAAYVTTAVAEYFRDQGKNVMLMMDSVTRFAQAQREIGLATGEPPTQRGYPPSVYDMIPKLLERSGTNEKGSITAFYTVLVDGDDMDDPIADKVRGTLDGHIVLSRALASDRHYPAVDVLQSISRLSGTVNTAEVRKASDKISRLIAIYERNKEMINAGVYQSGSNDEIDEAISKHKEIDEFVMQDKYEKCPIDDTVERLIKLADLDNTETNSEE